MFILDSSTITFAGTVQIILELANGLFPELKSSALCMRFFRVTKTILCLTRCNWFKRLRSIVAL